MNKHKIQWTFALSVSVIGAAVGILVGNFFNNMMFGRTIDLFSTITILIPLVVFSFFEISGLMKSLKVKTIAAAGFTLYILLLMLIEFIWQFNGKVHWMTNLTIVGLLAVFWIGFWFYLRKK